MTDSLSRSSWFDFLLCGIMLHQLCQWCAWSGDERKFIKIIVVRTFLRSSQDSRLTNEAALVDAVGIRHDLHVSVLIIYSPGVPRVTGHADGEGRWLGSWTDMSTISAITPPSSSSTVSRKHDLEVQGAHFG
jgi:hypothetical protein